jgi:DNA-binding CsgD family transcriptional regulator
VRADHVQVVAEAAYTAGRESGPRAAEHVLAILEGASHHVAAGLLFWDTDARRHRVLTSPGYPPAFVEQIHQQMMDGPVFRRLVQVARPLRFDDPPYDFRGLAVYRESLAPMGYGDGLSVALHADGRYTGMFHMNTDAADAFDDDVRDLVAALTPALARLCDAERPSLALLDEGYCAQLVVGGELREVSGRRPSPVLTAASPIRDVAATFLGSSAPTVRGLWADGSAWREVVLARVSDKVTGRQKVVLVGDRATVLPYGLSPREVDVLTMIARGASNARAASELVVTQRTVATHVEHILDKLGCTSRAAAAARATREGLVRLDLGEPTF